MTTLTDAEQATILRTPRPGIMRQTEHQTAEEALTATAQSEARAQAMCDAYVAGASLEEIARTHDVTRQRVHQIISSHDPLASRGRRRREKAAMRLSHEDAAKVWWWFQVLGGADAFSEFRRPGGRR